MQAGSVLPISRWKKQAAGGKSRATSSGSASFALSYPRERWYMRAAFASSNLLLRTTSGFRAFVHPERAMRRLIERAGFELVGHAQNMAWSADVFRRRDSAAVRPTT